MEMEMKKLGFGTMRLPVLNQEDPAAVDLEQLQAELHRLGQPQYPVPPVLRGVPQIREGCHSHGAGQGRDPG